MRSRSEHEYLWLFEEVILAIHDRLIAEHGGEPGILNIEQLRSAMARPKNAARYEDASVFDAAALYAHGVTKSHPFNDGNKRTAFMAAYTFLALDHLEINSSEEAATKTMLAFTIDELTVPEYSTWLENVSILIPQKKVVRKKRKKTHDA